MDALKVDLDLAEAIVALERAGAERDGLKIAVPSGPTRMTALHHGNNGRTVDRVWVARDGEDVVAWAMVELPWLDNLGLAQGRAVVHPDHRRQGLGSRLLKQLVGTARSESRTTLTAMAWQTTPGVEFLEHRGFTAQGQHPYDVRRLDLHALSSSRWQELYDAAAGPASDYELIRVAGPTPEKLIDGLVGLHAAINDAPADEGLEDDLWDAARVREYDASMVRRRQTTYRVLARHRDSGDWAGMSLLCVDEFAPSIANQEDTSVVRAHRGHRLGLLMKAEMLLWLSRERPEVGAVDTWNAADNHHMIAVNERLGAQVIGRNLGFRLSL